MPIGAGLRNSEVKKMAVQGERIAGGFILITGIDGTRYAVRQQAITVVHDADECRDETVLQLHGGMSCASHARSMRCWVGSCRDGPGNPLWCPSMPLGYRTSAPA